MSPFDRANRTARASQETLEASAQVIARRLAILGEAMVDPARADHAELSRMGTEKVAAMTASTGALVDGTLALTRQTCQIAGREVAEGTAHVQRLSRADSLDQVAALQVRWGFDLWTRTLSDGLSLTQSLMTTQARALSPIRNAAVANAQRLKD